MAYKVEPEPGKKDGKAEIVCWCGKQTKRLPLEQIRAGQTFSCGLRCSRKESSEPR